MRVVVRRSVRLYYEAKTQEVQIRLTEVLDRTCGRLAKLVRIQAELNDKKPDYDELFDQAMLEAREEMDKEDGSLEH